MFKPNIKETVTRKWMRGAKNPLKLVLHHQFDELTTCTGHFANRKDDSLLVSALIRIPYQ